MSSIAVLSEVLDSRKGGKSAKFNGFLEDYLNSDAPIKEEVRESLQKVLEAYPDFRILTDFRFNVNKEAISNQIIRYKDVTKLPVNYYDLAFILYGAINNQELCILVADGSRNVDYFLAKGMYYTLTEQHGVLEDSRQEVIVLTMAHLDELRDIINQFNNDPRLRVAPFQRRIDKNYFSNFEDLKNQVYEIAHSIKDNVREDLGIVKDRSVIIFRNIASWFLFKKLLYVSYMSNKDFLNTKAEGNMRQHRNNAKQIVDGVPFVAFSEMWRMKNVKPSTEPVVEEEVVKVEPTVEAAPVLEDESETNDPFLSTPEVDSDPEEVVEDVLDSVVTTPEVDEELPKEELPPVETEEVVEEKVDEEVVEPTAEAAPALEDESELNDPYLSTPEVDADPEEVQEEILETVATTPEVDEELPEEDLPADDEPVVEQEFPTDTEKEEIKL